MQSCVSCSARLSASVNFCPKCGRAIVINVNIAEKTTANFNPLNRDYKPWREVVLIPKRNYKVAPSISSHPWYPTMRQPMKIRGVPKKYLYEPNRLLVPEREERPHFLKDGIGLDAIEQQSPRIDAVPAVEAAVGIIKKQTIQNSVRKVHWLKIGVNLEDMNPTSDATSVEPNEGSDTRSNKNQTDHVEFKSLAHISNAVGKLIHMDENEWVDLHAAHHMRKVLERMAFRLISSPRLAKGLSGHQSYVVKFVTKTKNVSLLESYRDTMYMCDMSETEDVILKIKNFGVAPPQIFVFEQVPGSAATNEPVTNHQSEKEEGDLYFEPFILQFSRRVMVNRSADTRYCVCQIRVSVSYCNRIDSAHMDVVFAGPIIQSALDDGRKSDIDNAASASANASISYNGDGGGGNSSNSSIVEAADKPCCFTSSVDVTEQMLKDSIRPTHVNLLVYPISSIFPGSHSVIPPATLSFEIAVVSKLLPPLDKKNPVFVDMEQLLADGDASVLRAAAERLATLLRIEYTSDGVKYTVFGSFSSPVHTSLPWPSSNGSEEEHSQSAVGPDGGAAASTGCASDDDEFDRQYFALHRHSTMLSGTGGDGDSCDVHDSGVDRNLEAMAILNPSAQAPVVYPQEHWPIEELS